jgi:mannose-6-phosphate isomerase-like protein (cupin superfamily)
MYVLEGELVVDGLGDRYSQSYSFSMRAKEGESMEIERGRAHKLRADRKDLTIIEASTFHRDEDSYKLFE